MGLKEKAGFKKEKDGFKKQRVKRRVGLRDDRIREGWGREGCA